MAVANFMVIKFTAIKFRRIALARSNTRMTCITQVRDKVDKNSTLVDFVVISACLSFSSPARRTQA